MMRLEEATLQSRVKGTMGELLVTAEQLRNLGDLLDEFTDLNARADAEQIRQVATGIRATATQALLAACTALGLSERLSTIAHVREAAHDG